MPKYYTIDGYWVDDGTEFSGYMVKSTHDVDPMQDDAVFYYGLDEARLKEAVETRVPIDDFVVTAYYEETL